MNRYEHLSREALIALLERRDARRPYGLVWEREGITPDRAANADFVALDLDHALSSPTGSDGGWRNLVIEGDNWDALRALRLTCAGRVKTILIDPPYNTGNKDFVYNDRFIGPQDRYRQSVWLEFLYRRLVVARDLLADDGAILVCINDENRARLDLLMEQVFPGMRLGSFVWRTKDTNNSDKRRNWSGVHEHVLVYANPGFGFIGPDAGPGKFRLRPEFGDVEVRLDPITSNKTFLTRANTYYPIQNPATGLWYPAAPNQVWRFWSEGEIERQAALDGSSSETGTKRRKATAKAGSGPSMESFIRAGDIHFPAETKAPFLYPDRATLDAAIASGDVPKDGRGRPLLRADLPRLDFWVGKPIAHSRLSRIVRRTEDEVARRPVGSWIAGVSEASSDDGVQSLRSERQGAATVEIERLFGNQVFNFPKPSSLIRELVRATTGEGDLVLDFFAGSGTTGAAVLSLNAEDDAGRRFILVSNTESTEADPGKNLCRDVCAGRLRKVIDGHGADDPVPGDFAYLRTRRIGWDDVIYSLDDAAVWILLQLRHGRFVKAFGPSDPLQVSVADSQADGGPTVAYAQTPTAEAVAALERLAVSGPVVAFCPVPGVLRDTLRVSGISVEQSPGPMLAEYSSLIAGI